MRRRRTNGFTRKRVPACAQEQELSRQSRNKTLAKLLDELAQRRAQLDQNDRFNKRQLEQGTGACFSSSIMKPGMRMLRRMSARPASRRFLVGSTKGWPSNLRMRSWMERKFASATSTALASSACNTLLAMATFSR